MVREQCHRSIVRLREPSLTRVEIESFKYVTLLECTFFAVTHPDCYCAFTHTYESFARARPVPRVRVENPLSKPVDTPTSWKDNPSTVLSCIHRARNKGARSSQDQRK